MTTNPKVSIITVVFNAAETIEQTIKSVLNQTFNDWEFILVDGGSTDGTIEILEKYASQKILWKSEPDKGIYDAMNKGIKRASAEWVYFLGGDDRFYSSNVLEKIFHDMAINADFLYGNVFDERSKNKYDGVFDQNKLLVKNICHQGIFFRKNLFDEIGTYETRYNIYGDWEFNIRCFSNDQVKKEYVDVVIANFSAGGASAKNDDVLFFREVLFPKRLQNINEKGLKYIRNVKVYDEWWRLLRSMRLKKNDYLNNFSGEEKVPEIIDHMRSFQNSFPYKILKVGVFSKTLMFVSYCRNLITRKMP